VGDYFGVIDQVDMTGITLITFGMRLRNTTSSGGGVQFRASMIVDGSEEWGEEISFGELRDYTARTVNVSNLTGFKSLEIRLEAVTP
jgi:hypothetical protein